MEMALSMLLLKFSLLISARQREVLGITFFFFLPDEG